jgi:far upstream element-binding protein
LITIRGTVEAKEMAKQEIIAMVNEEPGQRSQGAGYGATTIYMQVPNDRVGVVIGKRGETIKGIQDRHLVRIQIPQVPDPGSNPPVRTISIQGPDSSLQGAKEEIDMIILQGAGSQGFGGHSQYGASGSYGGSSRYGGGGGGGYDQQQQYDPYGQQQQQQQQYGYGQGQYDPYYQQSGASTTADASAAPAATADPNDPNAYWNGYYEYAAYYGIDAANAAWGVTGEAAVAAVEAYKQYQEQTAAAGGDASASGATAGASSTSASTTDAASTSDASAHQVC